MRIPHTHPFRWPSTHKHPNKILQLPLQTGFCPVYLPVHTPYSYPLTFAPSASLRPFALRLCLPGGPLVSSIPQVSRQPLLRVVPPDMEDEVLARFFQRSCSLADLAHFTGCTIRAISKWFEREDVQADLQRIARFAQGRTGYLLQESTHLVMQNHEHLMGLLASDKFHYANSTTQARMMETARKAGNDLNKLRQDLDPNRPASTSRELKTSRAESSSRADFTSRDRQGAGELPSAHHPAKQLHASPPATRADPVER